MRKLFSVEKQGNERIVRFLGIKFAYYKRNRLTVIDEKLDELNSKFDKMEDLFKEHSNILFKYASKGIEMYPGKYSERVFISDYKKVLEDKTSYPDYYRDHIHRYIFAKKYLKEGDTVLDIASGTGYGARILKEASSSLKVIGADIAKNVVEFCNIMFSNEGLTFLNVDALNPVAFEENSFDVITSFETLEHVKESDLEVMLKNYLKWLKPGGKLICSTPNEAVYPYIQNGEPTMYHHKHYLYEELKEVFDRLGFSKYELFFQDTDCFGGGFKKEDKENRAFYLIVVAEK